METVLGCLEWDDSLLLGVRQMDERNRYLFWLLAKVSAASHHCKQADKVNPLINELIDQVMYHFTEEEQSMKEHQYPGLIIQERQHVNFVKTLVLELDVLHLNKIPTIESLEHFSNLLRSHIMTVDKKYAEYLKGMGNYCTKSGCENRDVTGGMYL